MKTIKLILAITVFSIASSLTAQTTGSIKGSVLDEKGKPMPFVAVVIYQDSSIVTSAQTDDNGEFRVAQITPGKYYLKATFTGYNIQLLNNVITEPNKTIYVELKMALAANALKPVVVTAQFHPDIVDKDFTSVTPIKIDQIENSAVGKTDLVALIISVTPGVLPSEDGKDIHIRGARTGTTEYIVDGNKTMGVPEVPGLGISGMEVLTGGVPAEYGDCTGGIVIITTKDYKWEASRKKIAKENREEAEGK
ncbi:MAG: carboxypeptidase regulatory-like domain-containing protein [Bacteroidia bacterium]